MQLAADDPEAFAGPDATAELRSTEMSAGAAMVAVLGPVAAHPEGQRPRSTGHVGDGRHHHPPEAPGSS